MNIFKKLFDWAAKEPDLKSVSLAALKGERLDLDNEARALRNKLDQLEKQADHLRDAYVKYAQDGKKSYQEILVREYREVREQIKAFQIRHTGLMDWMRVTSYLVMIKEDEALLEQRGRSGVFSMNLPQLQQYVETWLASNNQGSAQVKDLLDAIETEQNRVAAQKDAGDLEAQKELDDFVAAQSQSVYKEIEQALFDIDCEMGLMNRAANPALHASGGGG